MGLIKDFWGLNIVQDIMNHVHSYNICITANYLEDKTINVLLAHCHPFDREYYRSLLMDAGVLPKAKSLFRTLTKNDYV